MLTIVLAEKDDLSLLQMRARRHNLAAKNAGISKVCNNVNTCISIINISLLWLKVESVDSITSVLEINRHFLL